MRLIERVADKYTMWYYPEQETYAVTQAYRRGEIEIMLCSGTLSECDEFIARHPYGLTLKEATEIN